MNLKEIRMSKLSSGKKSEAILNQGASNKSRDIILGGKINDHEINSQPPNVECKDLIGLSDSTPKKTKQNNSRTLIYKSSPSILKSRDVGLRDLRDKYETDSVKRQRQRQNMRDKLEDKRQVARTRRRLENIESSPYETSTMCQSRVTDFFSSNK